jgi:phosphoglycolate phosphatase/putative hydrolase of the HAD superfamily
MKPDPKALHYITRKLKVDIKQCVFIGDRDELDGACARSVAMPYIIVDKDRKGETDLYRRLCEDVRLAVGSGSKQRQ